MAGEREQREALDKLHRQFQAQLQTLDLDSPEYVQAFQQMSQEWRTIREKIAADYPLNVPNAECHHAMLKASPSRTRHGKDQRKGDSPPKETASISSALVPKRRRCGRIRTTSTPFFWSK